MYIGKVKVNNQWQQLDTLIQAQVSGQSAFSFDADTTYQLQDESKYGIRLCEAASTPADENDGFVIGGGILGHYKPATGYNLYVRQVADTTCPPLLLKISAFEED